MMQMAMNNMQGMGGLGGMGGMGGLGGMGGMGGLGGMGGMGGGYPFMQPPQPAGDPKEAYKTQLEQLAAMGFTNESVNIDVLKQVGGNVEAAV